MMSRIDDVVRELGSKEIVTLDDLKEAYAKMYAFKTVMLTGKTHQISMPDELFSMLQDLTKKIKKIGVKGKINVNDLTALLVLMSYSRVKKILEEAKE